MISYESLERSLKDKKIKADVGHILSELCKRKGIEGELFRPL